MLYEFSLGEDADLQPGQWCKGERSNGPSVILCCPKCHHFCDLVQHNIDSNGIVTPSVLHSYVAGDLEHPDEPAIERCGFHEMVKLLDWKV